MGYNEKRNLSIAIIAVFTLVCVSITGASYAFFVATVTGTSTATNIKTADLKATYSDGAAITGTNIVPGWSATKTISIENTGTYSLVYTIKWVNVTNGGMTDLKYSLTSTSTWAQANVSNVAAPTKDGNLVTSAMIEGNVWKLSVPVQKLDGTEVTKITIPEAVLYVGSDGIYANTLRGRAYVQVKQSVSTKAYTIQLKLHD